jgi:hypothetical protein
LLLSVRLAVAAEVTLLRFDREQKQVTVREGEAEKVYRVTEKSRFFGVDPGGNSKEMSYDDAVKGLGNPKAEGALKFDLTSTGDDLAEARFRTKKLK